jgi:hypothetical protein
MTDPKLLRVRAEVVAELLKDEVSRKYGYCETLLWRGIGSSALDSRPNVDPGQGLELVDEILALTLCQEGRSIYRENFIAALKSLRKRLCVLAEERLRQARPLQIAPRPPTKLALALYLLMEDQDADAAAGDLEERFSERVKRLGERGARIWYAKQIVASVWPLLRACIGRVSTSAVSGLLGIVLRVVGLGGVADELKRAADIQVRRPGNGHPARRRS